MRQEIARWPRGAALQVVPYYGDPGGNVRRKYPFDVAELNKFAESKGVALQIPNAQ